MTGRAADGKVRTEIITCIGGKTYATYQCKIVSGKKPGDEGDLAHKLQECLASESGCWSNDDISVSFEEIGPDGFEETVKKAMKPEEMILTSKFVH